MENNPSLQQPRVIRKIRKIKRPKAEINQATKPVVPPKAGSNESQGKAPAPKISFISPEQQNDPKYVRNLPQANSLKQDTLYNKNSGVENIRFVSDDYPSDIMQNHNIAELLKNKTVLLLVAIAAIFGIIIGSSFSSESSKHGLDWVVANPDVPAGRSRCGLVDQHQGCVLYLMNPEKRNVTGKDFYSVAAKWTKRERYQIETGNMHYGSKQIKPGHIAQINIPPL